MEKLVKGDVIVIAFPFSDLANVKRRPALVIKVPKGDDILVSQITGKSYDKSVEVLIKKEDFQKGGLKFDSYVRLDKILTIEKSLVKYKTGELKQEKFNEILNKICAFLRD